MIQFKLPKWKSEHYLVVSPFFILDKIEEHAVCGEKNIFMFKCKFVFVFPTLTKTNKYETDL